MNRQIFWITYAPSTNHLWRTSLIQRPTLFHLLNTHAPSTEGIATRWRSIRLSRNAFPGDSYATENIKLRIAYSTVLVLLTAIISVWLSMPASLIIELKLTHFIFSSAHFETCGSDIHLNMHGSWVFK